jgi:predicted unusual protein kinase regulating ubiquinone biosynthesis (AarF/ABC1/UbiB family)
MANPFSRENRRVLEVILKLALPVLRYRRDRREIIRSEGKIVDYERFRRNGEKAARAFIELGPTFIKLGQLLSARPDVLPQPYIDEFAKLQDEVPPPRFDQVKKSLESEIGKLENVFDRFNEQAISGASLGVVYHAVYHGQEVVVKVRRPGVEELVKLDISVLKRLVPLVGRLVDPSLRFTAESIVSQFSETIAEEMDYKLEAEHLNRIRKNLKDDNNVLIPSLFPEISTSKVLVMQYIPGVKVTDVNKIDQLGLDRKRLARRITRLFLKMVLSQDIFHADPHPGNISVTKEGKIILYDFGMAGSLDDETRIKLIRLYTSIAQGDSSRAIDSMLDLGILEPTVNRYVIQRGLELAIADMRGKKVEEQEVRALLEVANRTIYQFPFKLPKNLVLYMRMSSILEGIGVTLDPGFRILGVLGGLLEQEGLTEEVYREDLRKAVKKFGEAIEASVELAPLLKEFLKNYGSVRPLPAPTRRGRAFLAGLLVGAGLFLSIISYLYIDTNYGKIGIIVALILLISSYLIGR